MTVQPLDDAPDIVSVLMALLGNEYASEAGMIAALLHGGSVIDPAALTAAINNISYAEAMGPMTDPTAFLDGTKFHNADEWKQILNAAHKFVDTVNRLKP